MKDTIDLMYVDSEVLSPNEFLRLYEKDRANIKRTEIVPPRLGDSKIGGGIRVTYHMPVYKFAEACQ